jgi:hypothetical protein
MTETLVPPFLVLGLPRSRTAWLSKFLSYGPWTCGHDEIRHCRTLEDVRSWFMQPFIGSAETLGATWWRLIPKVAPGCRVLVVRRPVLEVVDSLLHLGVPVDQRPGLLQRLRAADAKLDQVEARLPRVVSVQYRDLAQAEICRRVFEHCLVIPFDLDWWQHWNSIRVEADTRAVFRYWAAHWLQMQRLAIEARHHILADLIARPDQVGDGLVIQEESFEPVYREGRQMFEDHCVASGEAPDAWTRENIPVLETMDRMGLLQVMTARANGKLFGYLVTMVGTLLADSIDRSATHTLFYADKAWPGAGLRLQRAALAALKAKGIEEVFMRSGLGPGSRVEVLYRRLGAEPEGRLFKIRLGGG